MGGDLTEDYLEGDDADMSSSSKARGGFKGPSANLDEYEEDDFSRLSHFI